MLEVKIKKQLASFELDISFSSFNNRISILGASGAGKSMLLKCLAGLENPDSGFIKVNDKVLFDSDKKINLKPQLRKVGYLFQDYTLFPNLNVYKNIEIVIGKGNHEKINELLKIFKVFELKNYLPNQLSGGQKQRVALAQLVALDPEVILLDEPFSALDTTLKDDLIIELLDMLSFYEKDLIVVTHNKEEAFQLTEKLMVVHHGKNSILTSNTEIISEPRYLSVAKALGYKNFFIEDNNLYCINEKDIDILNSATNSYLKEVKLLRVISNGIINKAVFITKDETKVWVETTKTLDKNQNYYLQFNTSKYIKLEDDINGK